MQSVDLKARVESLIKKHGGLRAAAQEVGMDPAYLCKIRLGQKTGLTDKTLKKLGLRRIEVLRPL